MGEDDLSPLGGRGVFLGREVDFDHNVDCGLYHHGLLALPRPDAAVLPDGDVNRRDSYDATRPMPERGNCPP